ncbi:putative baseplate assembly protein [Actinotalea sp. M2MS4P-6]|uniref:putative baseplate assembly protein n=1 Tax=Actinotalea sp. M2MS4P-6 TaxID=2983762 RepID=UPI0021E49995|nr:putative baseplate assembly protein [Actinotalea sp. M2MS4P-6]MCV2395218.1 putative baseplate assembly protein [Actinotalea sp. M2MS4P-6]
MPIPPPNLDDRSFQDIVDETKRLIPRFTPEWTNHNVSDPGVALIELFAWMSEMVLFRVNQVPERLYVHFLNLAGIEPFPPSVAHTDVTFWLSAPPERPVVIPLGTEVTTSTSATDAVVFSTVREAVAATPRLTAAHSSRARDEQTVDGREDLAYPGSAFTCFGSTPVQPGDAAYLGFDGSLAGMALQLSVEATAQGIGVDPLNPPLAWEVWTGEAWTAVRVQSDTTGGLNRNGEIVLLVPDSHASLMLAGTVAYWLRVRLLRPAPGQPTYQASPRLESIRPAVVGLTVPAEHARRLGAENLGRSTGVPAQEFKVGSVPVAARRDGEVVRTVTPTGSTEWTEVEDFSASGPGDHHVVWESATGVVRFGPRVRYPDGTVRQHGAIPPDGAVVQVSGYRSGGGAAGNVGARTLTALRSTLPFVASVVNELPASGGVDAETVAEAKVRGPLSLRTGERAVTPGDFERLTREASVEVARARCLPGTETSNGAVRVLVVPHVRTGPEAHTIDDYALSAPLMRTIRDVLEERRCVGVGVEVGTPFYQGVSAAVLVRALPGRPAALVRQRVMSEVDRYVNPLTGGPAGTGWPFDTDLTAAELAQLIEAVEGVERVEEVQLFAYDLRNRRRLGSGQDFLHPEPHTLFLSAEHRVVVR